jgi:DNA ligase (NAD+)
MHAAKHMLGIPMTVSSHTRPFTVRGEVHITSADFLSLNEAREAAGKVPFVTARNAAAGSVRLHSGVEGRRLRFVAFELIEPEVAAIGLSPTSTGQSGTLCRGGTQWDVLQRLEKLQFGTVGAFAVKADGLDHAVAAAQKLMDQRSSLPYETDGCVLKVNALKACPALSFCAL